MKPFLAFLLSLVGYKRPAPAPEPASPPPSSNGFTFVQDGHTYVLAKGDVYSETETGARDVVTHLYDPDFYAKNYVVENGQTFQVDPDSGERFAVTRRFRDTFEDPNPISPNRWHNDSTDPARKGKADNYYDLGNRVLASRAKFRSGVASMRFKAIPSAKSTSKAALYKGILFFRKGDVVTVSGWFFLEQTPSVYDMGGFTLMDLESTFMQSVGLRVIIRKGDALAFELEFPKTSFTQDAGAEVPFPTGRWVHVRTRAFLSETDGTVQIWQDGRLVLNKVGRTLPVAEAIYDRFEIGVTAIGKGSRYEKVLYVDEIEISAEA